MGRRDNGSGDVPSEGGTRWASSAMLRDAFSIYNYFFFKFKMSALLMFFVVLGVQGSPYFK